MKKVNKDKSGKTLWISVVISALVAIIVGTLLIVKYCVPNKNSEADIKKDYLFNYSPSLIEEETSLKEKNLTLSLVTPDSLFEAKLVISTGDSNAMIGSYSEHDYLYRSYGESNNSISLTVNFYERENHTLVTDYEDLSFIVYLGENFDSKVQLDNSLCTINNNSLSYVDSNDIYLQSVVITVKL